MMKFHAAITTALASLVALPAVGLGDGRDRQVETLSQLLNETNRALQVLGGIEERIEKGEEGATSLIRRATESPILAERSRDERLVRLREEVNLLQTELDATTALLGPEATYTPAAAGGGTATTSGPVVPLVGARREPVGELRFGLSEAERYALERALAKDAQPSAPAPVVIQTTEGEHVGYSADPLAQARACYRAKQYQRGFELLDPIKTDPAALYWKGRCLEKLERLDEALTALQKVIEIDPNAFDAQRARSDIEFLQWKLEFVRQLPKKVAPRGGQNG